MPLQQLIQHPVVGVKPQDRLPITAKLWSDAHEEHRRHQRLHALAAHRPGIVYGLDVVVSPQNSRKVWVTPGVAIDDNGDVIVLSSTESFEFKEYGMGYLSIRYERKDVEASKIVLGHDTLFANFVEFRRIQVTTEPPKHRDHPFLELARVERSAPDAPIVSAANPFAPGRDELNLLYRRTSFPFCRADGTVGEVNVSPNVGIEAWNPNRAGLLNLLRTANASGLHVDFVGSLELSDEAGGGGPDRPPLLLYLSESAAFEALSDEQVAGLRALLRRGSLLVGDASHGDAGFVKSFTALAEALGARLSPLPAAHPILASQHRFAAPPVGASEEGKLLVDDAAGIVLSTFDYGGAWQGKAADTKALSSRERIRQAEEMGVNLLAFAADRLRRRELDRLIETAEGGQ